MAELKQCPFCGRTPTVEDCGTNRWFVRCKCGIAQDKLYYQRCDAVRAWNRRKSSRHEIEVVRCKDCKWFGDIGCAISIVDDTDKPSANDYCSFAERRTDG